MSLQRNARIAAAVSRFGGGNVDPRYLGFFDCFHGRRFFEAHEVLEALWLEDRLGPDGAFYKGLIQLAGAFVHLQKDRIGPAAALFRLARANLEAYPSIHHRLDLRRVEGMIDEWLAEIEAEGFKWNPGTAASVVKLHLLAE